MNRFTSAIATSLAFNPTFAAAASPSQSATRPAAGGLRVTAPLSPAESAARLHLKAGYAVDLVAAEPLVQSPVAFDWGPDGRLWVVEMADYPYGADGHMKPAGRVRVLSSSAGDGRYDRSTLFADDLNFPAGVLPWRNGVLVAAAPDLLYLEDTDGDGRADVRRVLYTGFAEGNPQLRVNGLSYGLDGWVYVANGLASKGMVRSTKTGQQVSVAGKDVRVRPDTGEIEAEAGPSQFGRRMSDDGDWFGVHNSFPGRHYVIPDRYARRNPAATLPPAASDLGLGANPKVYPRTAGQKRYGTAFFAQAGRYTSACGVSPYRDVLLFPPRPAAASAASARGDGTSTPVDLFVCEPVHNLVQHLVLAPAGATYAAARAADEQDGEFLASTDDWFRPVYTATGPDGGLWVADMSRFMIEHPDWLPADGQLDYAPYYRLGADRGRIWRVRRADGAASPVRPLPRLDTLATPDLVRQLTSSPSGPRRDLVRAMLAWRNDPAATGPLAAMAGDAAADPLARLHALCALDVLGRITPTLLLPRLADPSPAVRRHAIRLAEPLANGAPDLLAAALKLVDDPDPKVRLQLALSLGEWDGPAADEALGKLAVRAGDDAYMAGAVMTSAGRHRAAVADAVLAGRSPPAGILRDLQAMALDAGDRDGLARLLLPVFAVRGGRHDVDQLDAFGRLLDLFDRHRTSIAALSAGRTDALADCLRASDDLFAAARVAAGQLTAPEPSRLAGLRLLGRDPARVDEDVRELAAVYAPGAPPAVQAAAARSIARTGRADVPTILLLRWADRPPAVRAAVVDALVGREAWATALLARVKTGDVPAGEVDAARRDRLLRHASAAVRASAAEAFAGAGSEGREAVVARYRSAAEAAASPAADPARGRTVFAANCATCHRAGATPGADIGPDLSSVAGWTPEALLTAILDPSRSAEPRFLGYTCTLDSGEVAYGLVVRETPAGVTMKGLDGAERTIPRGQIKSLECTNKSLMPEGLEAAVDAGQMADLIRFLRQ